MSGGPFGLVEISAPMTVGILQGEEPLGEALGVDLVAELGEGFDGGMEQVTMGLILDADVSC